MPGLPFLLATLLAGTEAQATVWLPPEHFRLRESTWSVALDAEAGLGVQVTPGSTESFPSGGALLRTRLWHFEFGGFGNAAVLSSQYLLHVGGLAGAYLPFYRWVELEVAAGYGKRVYMHQGSRSYLGDYRVAVPAGTIRFGVADRTGDVLGFRVGAAFVMTLDLEPQDRRWHLAPTPSDPQGKTGLKHFGGFSAVLAITFGLDLWPDAIPDPRPLPARTN